MVHEMRADVRQISPITGPRCPEGSRKLWFPYYMTLAQDDGCQPYAPAAFYPQEMLLVLISVRG